MWLHCPDRCLGYCTFRHDCPHCPLGGRLVTSLRLLSGLLLPVGALCRPVTWLMANETDIPWTGCPVGGRLPVAWLSSSGLVALVLVILSSGWLLADSIPLIEGALAARMCDFCPRFVVGVVTQSGMPGWCAWGGIIGCRHWLSGARLTGLSGISPRL